MKIRSQKDFVAGLLLILIGLAFAVGATDYSFGTAVRPGPGYFPFGLGIILALLGVVVLLSAFTSQRTERTERTDGDPVGRIPWRPLLCVVGAIVFFGVALPRLGFFISLPVMIVLTSAGSREFSWRDALLNAAVLTLASYAIFIYGLQLTMPLWPAL